MKNLHWFVYKEDMNKNKITIYDIFSCGTFSNDIKKDYNLFNNLGLKVPDMVAFTSACKSKNINLRDYKDMSDLVLSVLTIIPLQLLAYNVASLRGLDIDKPKNLAKSVTVE